MSALHHFCAQPAQTVAGALTTIINVQVEGSQLESDAIRYLRNFVPEASLTGGYFRPIAEFAKAGGDDSGDLFKAILDLIPRATVLQTFTILARSLLILSAALPKKSKRQLTARNRFSGAFSSDLKPEYLAFLFRFAAEIADLLPAHALELVINLGVTVAESDVPEASAAFAQFLAEIGRKSLVKSLGTEIVISVIKLLFHGDLFYSELTAAVLPTVPLETVNDPVAKFWLAVVDGKAQLPAGGKELESVKTAAVFADSLICERLISIMQNTPATPEPDCVQELGTFFLVSPEIRPHVALCLLKELERSWGRVAPPADRSVPLLKRKRSGSQQAGTPSSL
jgi:hypothetical protein